MISLALIPIINATYGAGVHRDWILGKWLLIGLVFLSVYCDTLDPILSLMWMVAYACIRVPELSGEGFGVFSWSRYSGAMAEHVFSEAARFMLWRSYWVVVVCSICFVSIRYWPLVCTVVAALFHGLPYIILGRIFGERLDMPRKAEYLAGMVIGLMVYLSWRGI